MMYNMRFSGGRNGYIAETGAPLPPLTSAPGAKNGITIKLPGANNGSAPSLGINAQLSGFAVTAPADIYTHSPFKISVRALAPDGTTLTNYTGTLYFDLISGSSSNISPLLTEEGFTFTPDNK